MRYTLALALLVGCATGPSPAEQAEQRRLAAEYQRKVAEHQARIGPVAAAAEAQDRGAALEQQRQAASVERQAQLRAFGDAAAAVPSPAPPAPPPPAPTARGVNCTTTNVAGTLYTNCY